MSNDEEYEIEYQEVLVSEDEINEDEEKIKEETEKVKKTKKKKDKICSDNFGLICKTCYQFFENKHQTKDHVCKKMISNIELKYDIVPKLVIEKESQKREIERLKDHVQELESSLKILKYKTDLINKIYSEMNKITFEHGDPDNIFVEISLNKDKKKKDYFRAVTGNKAEEKNEEEIKLVVKNLENNLKERSWKYFNETKEELLEKIEEAIKGYEKDKKLNNLAILKDKRPKLLRYYNIEEYTNLLQNHFKRIEAVDKANKQKYRFEQMYTLFESRLLFIDAYISQDITNDDIEMINLSFEHHRFNTILKPFNKIEFYKKLQTVELAYFSIPKILKMELAKPEGLCNIIFINLNNKQKINDPFTYYYLDKIDKEKRLWKMDWRLLEISEGLKNVLIPYLVSLFRKFYYLITKDNVYRKDIMKKTGGPIKECEQILENIIFLSDHIKYVELFQKIVKENASYNCTINDKVDLSSDDREQARVYETYKTSNYEDQTLCNFESLFDDPQKEDIIELYKNKISEMQ